MLVALVIAAISFSSIVASIAFILRNVALVKTELLQGIEKRNAYVAEQQFLFEKK
jgi:hypothetical protein